MTKAPKSPKAYRFKPDRSSGWLPHFDLAPDEPGAEHFMNNVLAKQFETLRNDVRPLWARHTNKKPLRDVFYVDGALFCVNYRVKDIIDGLEPGVHLFYPIRLFDAKGHEYQTPPHYILLTPVAVNAILTPKEEQIDSNGVIRSHVNCLYGGKISEPEMAGRHLWRQIYASYSGSSQQYFMSPDLFAAFKKAKIVKVEYTEFDIVSTSWDVEENMGLYLKQLELDDREKRDFINSFPQWVRKYRPSWLS